MQLPGLGPFCLTPPLRMTLKTLAAGRWCLVGNNNALTSKMLLKYSSNQDNNNGAKQCQRKNKTQNILHRPQNKTKQNCGVSS